MLQFFHLRNQRGGAEGAKSVKDVKTTSTNLRFKLTPKYMSLTSRGRSYKEQRLKEHCWKIQYECFKETMTF